ncbi:hypothetical protein B0H13DRAFT_2653325 [Mycena leptocephala]|nr:hypothetical protein B0H13DRAFT_2653325 [Mycena leptocephala]
MPPAQTGQPRETKSAGNPSTCAVPAPANNVGSIQGPPVKQNAPPPPPPISVELFAAYAVYTSQADDRELTFYARQFDSYFVFVCSVLTFLPLTLILSHPPPFTFLSSTAFSPQDILSKTWAFIKFNPSLVVSPASHARHEDSQEPRLSMPAVSSSAQGPLNPLATL